MALTTEQSNDNRKDVAGGKTARNQTAVTAIDAGTADSGDATTDGVIDNNRTRLSEVIVALQDLGILA